MRVLRLSHSAVVDEWRERERLLRSRGVDVGLISARKWDEGGRPVHLEPQPGETVTGAATLGRHPALFLYDPRPIWRAMGSTWDVIDVHEEPFALATAEILLLRWLRGQRAPYTLYSAQNIHKRYPIPFRWLEQWALRSASGMSVCNSRAGTIVERKGFPGRATLIPLGVSVPAAEGAADGPAGGDEVPTASRDRRDVHVAYAGRLETHKGVDVLLDAIALEPRLHLRIAGAGSERVALEARVQREGLAAQVEFTGALSGAALARFYQSADVLAVPSLSTPSWVEQFGRVAVEAMAVGTPVVASASGALPDVVGDAGRLVPEGDPEALARELLKVGTDPELSTTLRRKAVARAQTFSWDSVAVGYQRLYRQVTHAVSMGCRRSVEIIVVAFGRPDLLKRALEPLSGYRVVVVDNSSCADVAQVTRTYGASYIDPGRNGGFAAGVNEGLRHTDPSADVLLLNPDAVVSSESVERLQQALAADCGLASVAPAQVDEHGRPSRVAWPFPSPGRAWLEAAGLGRMFRNHGFVIGSVLLLRREAIDQVGAMDERFFLYAEETDWAYRAVRLGWRHAVVPEATALHLGAATSTDSQRREGHFHASQERYLRKHYGSLGWQIARVGQIAGSALRVLVLSGPCKTAAASRARLYARGPVRMEPARETGEP